MNSLNKFLISTQISMLQSFLTLMPERLPSFYTMFKKHNNFLSCRGHNMTGFMCHYAQFVKQMDRKKKGTTL